MDLYITIIMRGIPTIELEEDFSQAWQDQTDRNLREFSSGPGDFEKTRFSSTEVRSRLHETAYLNPNLTIHFMDLRGDTPEDITYHEPDGIVGYIKDLNHNSEALHEPIYLKGEADGIQVGSSIFQYTTNSVRTYLASAIIFCHTEGGTILPDLNNLLQR